MRSLTNSSAPRTSLLAVALAVILSAPCAFAQGAAGSGPPPTGAAGPAPVWPVPPAPTSGAASAPEPSIVAPAAGPAAPAAPGPTAPVPGAASAAPPAPGAAFATAPAPGAVGPLNQLRLVLGEMPASAYPSPTPRVRGIYGGSLWLDADNQGMQWPYYPGTGIGFSGYGWVDTGLRSYHAGESTGSFPGLGTQSTQGRQFVQQSRFLLRTTPTWTDPRSQFFVQMQVELVGAQINTGQSSLVWSADDAWVRFGKWKLFDVLLGRFQAWEVYHYGMGLDLYTLERTGAVDASAGISAPQIYGLTYMYLRQDVLGQGAVHLYPADWLRFEVGFQYGAGTNGLNTYGVRPVGIAEFGPLRFKLGAEFLESRPQTTGANNTNFSATQSQGVGGAIQLVLDPDVELGVNAAYAVNDTRGADGTLTATGMDETWSAGGFANVRVWGDLLVGGGFNYTYWVDEAFDKVVGRNDHADQVQPYGAIQYLFFKQPPPSPSPGLIVKFVFAYARADVDPTPLLANAFRNEMFSGRLRLEYLF